MNTPFDSTSNPDYSRCKYYVYYHVDPRDNQVKYIGKGHGQRAWMMRNSGHTAARYGHRRTEHWDWFLELETLGYTLEDIVVLHTKHLTESEALALEKKLVNQHGYDGLFNRDLSRVHKKISPEIEEAIRGYRSLGLSYKDCALMGGTRSAMTAWRIINE